MTVNSEESELIFRHGRQGCNVWQDPSEELCPLPGDSGDAQSAGGAKDLLPVVFGHWPERGVQGCGLYCGLRRQSGVVLCGFFHGREAQV